MAEAHGLGVMTYSPLGGGLLTGKYRRGEQGRLSTRPTHDDDPDAMRRGGVVDALLEVAEELGASPTAVSLAWLRRRAATSATAIVPIVGPRSPEHLASYLAALDIELHPTQHQRLEAAGTPRLGAPHDDVAAALDSGVDGDRALLRSAPAPVP